MSTFGELARVFYASKEQASASGNMVALFSLSSKCKREIGGKQVKKEGQDLGLAFPCISNTGSSSAQLSGLASVFIQPLFFFTPRLHTVACLGNLSSWNIHEKSSAPLS